MRAWMESSSHRANILDRAFSEAGIGVVLGLPRPGGYPGATYSTGFGAR